MHDRAVRSALLLLFLSLSLSGCGGAGYRIERTVGGAVRSGPFVPPYAYEHFVRGELALAHGEYARAAEEYGMARSGADDDPLLCAQLARALHLSGDARAARAALEDGFRLDPASEAVHLAAGFIDEANGDLEAALAHDEAALSAAPRSRAAIDALVSLLDRMGDGARAARILAQHADGDRIEASLAEALLSGDVDRAMSLVRLGGRLPRSARVRAAEALFALGRPVLAAEVLAPIESAPPEVARERRIRIAVAVAMDRRSEAEGLLALPIEGDATELLADARAYVALGNASLAEELARASSSRAPSLEGDVVLASALLAQGRADEAASLAARVPAGSSVSDEASAIVREALRMSGLPALAAELP